MRSVLGMLAVLAVVAGLAACARDAQPGGATEGTSTESSGGDAPPPAPYYGDQATMLDAEPGAAFTVLLPRDPSGAETWMLDPAHDQTVARLEAEGDLDAAPDDCETCTAGGQHYFHFVATGFGRVEARFGLKRAGDVTAPMSREVMIQMRVESSPSWAQ